MKLTRHRSGGASRRRTTLTLPADSLDRAERIARARRVNLSTVISEAVAEGLRVQDALERSEQVLNTYRKAFSEFTDEEMAVLDGLIMEPVPPRRR